MAVVWPLVDEENVSSKDILLCCQQVKTPCLAEHASKHPDAH